VELFTIQCTTCKARLVVKDESVIGDILACPKCNSMVQVVPPVGWKRPGSSETSHGELPQLAESTPQAPAPVMATNASGSHEKAAATAVPPALPPRPVPATGSAPAVPVPDLATPSPFAAATAWAKRDWMIPAGSLLGGAALGTVAWAVLTWQSPEPVIIAQGPASTPPLAQAPEAVAPTPAPATAQPAQSMGPAKLAQREVGIATAPAPDSNAEPQEETAAVAEDGPPQAAASVAKATQAAAPSKPAPALKLEPIPFARPPLEPAPPVPVAVPSAAEEPLPAEVSPEGAAADEGDGESRAKPTPLAAEQIEERLSVSLSKVEFAGVTIAQFATFISDIIGVPVTLDEAALAKGAFDRKTPISVKLSETTADEVLRTALEGAGLGYVIGDNGRIVVTTQSR
jgi:hypothetical protein